MSAPPAPRDDDADEVRKALNRAFQADGTGDVADALRFVGEAIDAAQAAGDKARAQELEHARRNYAAIEFEELAEMEDTSTERSPSGHRRHDLLDQAADEARTRLERAKAGEDPMSSPVEVQVESGANTLPAANNTLLAAVGPASKPARQVAIHVQSVSGADNTVPAQAVLETLRVAIDSDDNGVIRIQKLADGAMPPKDAAVAMIVPMDDASAQRLLALIKD